LPTFGYWKEMSRVCRVGGFVVFDILTEVCLEPSILHKWIGSAIDNGAYPAAIPREAAINFFKSESFDLKGSFLAPMGPGFTEVFVFQKIASKQHRGMKPRRFARIGTLFELSRFRQEIDLPEIQLQDSGSLMRVTCLGTAFVRSRPD
jgi:hypothetical protein